MRKRNRLSGKKNGRKKIEIKEELRKKMQAKEDELSRVLGVKRVKVVERGGTSLEHILFDMNPWSKRWCGREDCRVCKRGEGQLEKCRKEGVV